MFADKKKVGKCRTRDKRGDRGGEGIGAWESIRWADKKIEDIDKTKKRLYFIVGRIFRWELSDTEEEKDSKKEEREMIEYLNFYVKYLTFE